MFIVTANVEVANETSPPPSPSPAVVPCAVFPLTVLRVMFVVVAAALPSVRIPPWKSLAMLLLTLESMMLSVAF